MKRLLIFYLFLLQWVICSPAGADALSRLHGVWELDYGLTQEFRDPGRSERINWDFDVQYGIDIKDQLIITYSKTNRIHSVSHFLVVSNSEDRAVLRDNSGTNNYDLMGDSRLLIYAPLQLPDDVLVFVKTDKNITDLLISAITAREAAELAAAEAKAESERMEREEAANRIAGRDRETARSGVAAAALADLMGTGSGQTTNNGLYDPYAALVILAVQPNWSASSFSRDNLTAQIRIVVNADGLILSSQVERSSGNAAYDASAINSIERTRILPKPPTNAQHEVIVNFNSLQMGG